MIKFNLLKIVKIAIKPVIALLVFSMYCFIVALAMFLLTTADLFSEELRILDSGVSIIIYEVYLPILGKLFETLFPISQILYLLGVVYLFIKDGAYLYRYLSPLKIALIPFWILTAICMIPLFLLGAFAGSFLVPFFGMFILPVFFIVCFYVVFIITSISNILFLEYLRKNKRINTFMFVLNLIMQCCYFWDMASMIYLKTKYKGITVNQDK